MTDAPKPTLTEAERQQADRDHLADLIHEAVNAGGDDLTFDLAYSIAGCFVGSEWLKEHVAATRREALLEARRVVASVTVLSATSLVKGHQYAVQECAGALDRLTALFEAEDNAALAEPERDEEGR